MRRITVSVALGALALGAALLGAQGPAARPAQRKVPATPGVWKGVILSVDVQDRLIEVVGPNGGLHQFSIPVTADKLFNVKVGDTVSVKYVESIVVAFQQASAPPMTAPPDKVTVTPAGLPDLTDVHVKVVNAKVTAVDTATRIITFTTAGNVYHYTVGPGVKGLSQIKVGDDLILRATVSTAIDITK
jgi:hypothetical protein